MQAQSCCLEQRRSELLRHVKDDLFQIGESVAGRDGWHEAVRVYVLMNDGCPLLFDSGSHIHSGEIMAELKSLLGDTAPGYVFLTHTELPHTGNIKLILDVWPDTKLVVSSAILPHVELPWWVADDQVLYGYAGTEETYGGRRISFLDGILKDQPGTHWMYDGTTGTLFTADAFGYLYPGAADLKFDDELEDGIAGDWLKRYHESAFRFLPMVSGAKVTADIARVFRKRDVRAIAPTHGNAVRHDIAQCIDRFNNAILEICR
ncbi:MBL fold metallo-hydrolase [Leisingera sp. ANG59]|uniref:MBL fold metallo-hydrolase n=1 Tax=Leisingera sp. ANG59 TaxID=2675221 RepID=UPI00157310DF|nr:MBL fold metallo-hydrolase [Leisingera sp. ANG59]